MKRLFLILTALLLVTTLCSCNIIHEVVRRTIEKTLDIKDPDIVDTNPYQTVETPELTYSEGYKPVKSDYSYNALRTEGERELYEKLDDIYMDISPEYSQEAQRYPMPEVRLDGRGLSEVQVRTVLKALTDDRPDFFWACGTVGYYSDPELTLVQMYSLYSPEEVGERLGAMRAIADEFFASVPDGLSEYERELKVHDWLLGHTEYDKTVDTDNVENNDREIYTAYGAMVDKVAVCEGYSRAYQLLLNGLGVDCVCVSGYSNEALHMWNEVRLNGEWYATDATWDDREEDFARWCFFNLSSEQMARDHKTGPMFYELSDDQINGEYEDVNADIMNMVVPECTDESLGYYAVECPRLDDYDGVEVKNALLEAARAYEDYFVFYVDEELDYEETVDLLFRSYPQYFFSYVTSVNGYLEDYSIDGSNAVYITLDRNRAVVAELHYY